MKHTKAQPLGTRLLLRAIKESEVSEGGMALPKSAVEKPCTAEVVALGTGKDDFTFSVKEGDIVAIPKYGATELLVNNEKLLVLPEEDVIAILSN